MGSAGPPGVIQAFTTAPGGNPVVPDDNTYHPVVTLNIPASASGTYLVSFAFELYNNFNSDNYGNST